MKLKLVSLLAAASALLASTQAGAASYSTAYVADPANAQYGSVSGSGDTSATVNVGDSLTVSFSAPTGEAFQSSGGFMFDYQVQNGAGSLTDDVTYAFYSGASVLASGSLTGEWACCGDIRVPVYALPTGTWDKLVYTATLTSAQGPAVLENDFNYSMTASYVAAPSAVPEASDAAMILTGLGLFAVVARRRRAG